MISIIDNDTEYYPGFVVYKVKVENKSPQGNQTLTLQVKREGKDFSVFTASEKIKPEIQSMVFNRLREERAKLAYLSDY